MVKKLLMSIGIASMLAMAACSNEEEGIHTNQDDPKPLERITLSPEEQSFVTKTNDFAFSLTSQVLAKEEGDMTLSPLSAAYVLGMLQNGAKGQTQKQIAEALGFGESESPKVNEYFRRLMEGAPMVDENQEIAVANAIIANKRYRLKDTFVKAVKESYHAEVENYDFTQTNVADNVNRWAKDHTHGMIPKILEIVDPEYILLAINAIYFNGEWTEAFDEAETTQAPFTSRNGETCDVPMMHRWAIMHYAANDLFSIVKLPYGNGGWSMELILPAEGKSIPDVIESLNGDTWKSTLESMSNYKVDLKLPRFETEYSILMNEALMGIGITDAFTQKADFSELCDVSAELSFVLQKAKIEVDEKGTRMAAVTTAGMEETAAGDEITIPFARFHANRPFIYLLTENTTGSIYMVGVKTEF